MDISQTVSEMVKCKTFADESELVVLVHIIKCPIAVHYEDAAGKTLFGEAYQDSAESGHLLNYPDSDNSPGHYDLSVIEERQEGQPKDLPNAGRYVVWKQQWCPGLVVNVDKDANDFEVKFMYPSAKKHNKFCFGNAGPVWCTAGNIILVSEAPKCDDKEVYSFSDDIISKVEQFLWYKGTLTRAKDQKQKLCCMHGCCSIVNY